MMTCPTPQKTRFIGDEDTLDVWWTISGDLIDYSSGYTFVGKLSAAATPATIVFTKTTGFTGAVGSGTEYDGVPNLVVAWATTGELNSVTPGRYLWEVVATKTSDSSQSTLHVSLVMKARLG